MKTFPLVHYYDWHLVPDALLDCLLAEFADHGVTELVLCNDWCKRFLREPTFFVTLLTHMRYRKLRLTEAHAPYGPLFDLNCSVRAHRETMLAEQKKILALAAEAGCRSVTIHIGAYDCYHRDTTREQMRDFADASLESLLQEAQKQQILIAVENSFEPFNPPEEVIRLMDKFACDNLGCCYDSGHANMMAAAPGKVPESYPQWLRDCWHDQFPFEPDALGKLAPYIITCHLHDNNGVEDLHAMPGTGTIDWPTLMTRIRQCPRLISCQSEVSTGSHATSIEALSRTFAAL